jgi:hypothetical protein
MDMNNQLRWDFDGNKRVMERVPVQSALKFSAKCRTKKISCQSKTHEEYFSPDTLLISSL